MTYDYSGVEHPCRAWACSCGGLLKPERDGGSGSSNAELTYVEQVYLCPKCGQHWNHQQAFKLGRQVDEAWELLQAVPRL